MSDHFDDARYVFCCAWLDDASRVQRSIGSPI
jgi:hypothetical protein